MLKKLVCILVSMVLLTSVAFADELKATLSQDEVAFGETFDLILTYDGTDANGVQIDLGALQNDFAVYSTSSSIRSSFVNGVGSITRQWKIGLMPKKTGTLTIPALSAGTNKSQPLTVNVLPATSSVNKPSQSPTTATVAAAAKVDVDLSVDNNTPYVQQELNAVLSINDNIGIEFAAEPQFVTNADEWIVKSLRQPTVEANGQGGRLIKFYYALFPQKSGLQQIPPMQIDGYYTSFDEASPRASMFGGFADFFDMNMGNMFGIKKPIKLVTKPQNVTVLPIAAGYGNDWWLPATAVGVAARWVEDNPSFKVGETVVREIAFAAAGVADTQLPEIVLPANKYIKQYPEQPQIETIADDNHITSQLKMRIVYIPQAGGKQTIPEIKIPWYNVNTKQKEVAIIPAVTVDVEGQTSDNIADEKAIENNNQSGLNQKTPTTATTKILKEPWLLVALAFFAGILLSYLFLKRMMQKSLLPDTADISAIEHDLAQKDYHHLRDTLLEYGRQTYKGATINNLNDLSAAVDNVEFGGQMQKLNGILYANQQTTLDDKIILQALKQHKKNAKHKDIKPLPELYR